MGLRGGWSLARAVTASKAAGKEYFFEQKAGFSTHFLG